MYGYVVSIRYKIRAKHGDMPHVILTKRAIRLAGTYLWHTNPIEKGIAQATKTAGRRGQEARYLHPTPCSLPRTGAAIDKDMAVWIVPNKIHSRRSAIDYPISNTTPAQPLGIGFFHKMHGGKSLAFHQNTTQHPINCICFVLREIKIIILCQSPLVFFITTSETQSKFSASNLRKQPSI